MIRLIRSDSVTIEGYINAVERNSKPLVQRIVAFAGRVIRQKSFFKYYKVALVVRLFRFTRTVSAT